jgi:hypothetical protein
MPVIPKTKRTSNRKQRLAAAGATPAEKREADVVLRLARLSATLAIASISGFSAYLVFDRYFDNSSVLSSPLIRYVFPLIAIFIVVLIYHRILLIGPPFRLGRIEAVSIMNIRAAIFLILVGAGSTLFTKSVGTEVQTPLFVIGIYAVLGITSAVTGRAAYEALKSRQLQDS